MAKYTTQFGSTVNVPDDEVDKYRATGLIGRDDKPVARRKATRRKPETSDDE